MELLANILAGLDWADILVVPPSSTTLRKMGFVLTEISALSSKKSMPCLYLVYTSPSFIPDGDWDYQLTFVIDWGGRGSHKLWKIDILGPVADFGYNKTACHSLINLLSYSWPDEQHHDLSPVSLCKSITHSSSYLGRSWIRNLGELYFSVDVVSNVQHARYIWDYALIYNSK